MTKEEIELLKHEADELFSVGTMNGETIGNINRASALMGAEWMQEKCDKQLKEHLETQKEDLINSACTYIENEYNHIGRYSSIESFTERLREAMEK